MSRLLIASNNPGKVREFQDLLALDDLEILTPAQLGLKLDIAETGSTYAENASLKAAAFASAAGIITLADDSGLEVDAIDGLPGLHSKRFLAEPEASDSDRRRLLVTRLLSKPRPWTARFRCVLALAVGQGAPTFAEGTCEGEIIPAERGQNGFGYDPIFLISEFGKTMAELSMAEKNQLSHRARAIKAVLPELKRFLAIS